MRAAAVLLALACVAFSPVSAEVESSASEGQVTSYETILMFECKMSLQYVPDFGKFLFAQGSGPDSPKYYTACSYENYMWHHAYVSIDEDGTGMLIVDGEQQELVTATNELDLLEGFSDPLGNTFSTTMYPTKCVVSEVATRKARSLLQVPSPDAAGLERVGDGFVDASAMLPTDAVSNATCCSFRIGQRCGGLITDGRNDENEAKPFYGMIDEVAVYNRPLDQADVRGVMWAMASNRKVHALAAPAGAQLDYTAGRVFYARFNRPAPVARRVWPAEARRR
jgi:hypothetical protein